MKKIIFPLFGLAALLTASLSSCKTANSNVTLNQVNCELAGKWYFSSIGSKPITPSPENEWPHLEFNTEESRISGNIGCNQVMGSFSYTDKGALQFDNLASTRMLCADMSIEDALSEALPKVQTYSINKVTGTMVLGGATPSDTIVVMTRMSPRTMQNYRQSY